MNEVTRYDVDDYGHVREKEHGRFVSFADFQLATKARDGVFSQVVKSLTEERDAALAEMDAFTKHVGANSFKEAVDTTLRATSQYMDVIEKQFNTIKALSKDQQRIEWLEAAGKEGVELLPIRSKDGWVITCIVGEGTRCAGVGEKTFDLLRAAIDEARK